jgi:hypothetical protein
VFDAFEIEHIVGAGIHYPVAQILFLSSLLKTGYLYLLSAMSP